MDIQQQSYLRKQNIPFTMVCNAIIFDSRISSKAKFYYVYLSSKPDGWKFHTNCIIKEIKEGRDAFYSGLKELIEFGYLERTQMNECGKFKHTDFLLKIPPYTENTDTEIPYTENTDYNNKDINNKDKIKKDIKDTASGFSSSQGSYSEIPNNSVSAKNAHTQKQKNEEFNQFWEEYGKKVKKPKAEESFKKAIKTKDTTFQSIMNGVKKYNEYLNVATWCPKAHPTSWLNESRWNDDYDDLIKQEYKKQGKIPQNAPKSDEKQQEEVKMKEHTQDKRKAILSRLNAKELEFTYFLRKHLINDLSNPVHSMWIENLVFSCKNDIALIEVESETGVKLNWEKIQRILRIELQGKFEFTEIKWKLID